MPYFVYGGNILTMNLPELVKKVDLKFKDALDLETRTECAALLAAKYKFESPELVLFITHPELASLPISERCRTLGITEEQLALSASQPGFQKMMLEYQGLLTSVLRLQSLQKLGKAVGTDRVIVTKMGAIEDYGIEEKVMAAASAEKTPASSVNVQLNVWDRAKEKAAAIQGNDVRQNETIVISPT